MFFIHSFIHRANRGGFQSGAGKSAGRASPVANGRQVGPWRIRKRRDGTIPRPIHTGAEAHIYIKTIRDIARGKKKSR